MKSKVGFLIDLDGVVHQNYKIIPGSDQTIEFLNREEFPFLFLTNTTMKSRDTLAYLLNNMGIKWAHRENIINAAYATSLFLSQKGSPSILLLCSDDSQKDFSQFQKDEISPDYVVVGDMHRKFSFEILTKALKALQRGAELIAMQNEPFEIGKDGLRELNVGAWVALLSTASGKTPVVIGKPNDLGYRLALEKINLPPSQVFMIGDTVETDFIGALKIGLNTIMVKTGKFNPNALKNIKQQPNYLIDSFSDLPKIFSGEQNS